MIKYNLIIYFILRKNKEITLQKNLYRLHITEFKKVQIHKHLICHGLVAV